MRFETTHGTEILKELGLPWSTPLADWPEEESARLTEHARMVRTRGRRFIIGAFPEVKAREVLSRLETLHAFGQPVVEPVGLVTDRAGLPALLVTCWPHDAHPLEDVLGAARETESLVEALALHLVHLHLAGYHGGAGTLANPLIQREEDRHAAILADLTDGELVSALTCEQRRADLHAARVNLARTVREANHRRRERLAAEAFAGQVVDAYTRLWTRTERGTYPEPGELAVRTRVFDMRALPEETRTRLREGAVRTPAISIWSRVSDGGDHRLMLHLLTGLDVRDDRSRDLLRDVDRHRGWLEMSTGRPWPRALAANRWLCEVYQPALDSLAGLRTGEACH